MRQFTSPCGKYDTLLFSFVIEKGLTDKQKFLSKIVYIY